MSLIFNDPNFDPKRLKAIEHKFKSGVSQEVHERMLADGLKAMKFPRAMLPSDIEALILETNQRIKMIAQYAHIVDAEVKASGKDHNKAFFLGDLQKRFLEGFSHYNKDQLLIVLTKFFTELVTQDII